MAQGGGGTWDTSSLTNWGAAAGGPFSSAWVNANNDTAIFGGTVGTVTNTVNITVGGLVLSTANFILTNDPGVALSFVAGGTISNNVTATIGAPIGGTGPITKTGAGTLILNGVNTYTGDTAIDAGTLQIGMNNIPNGAKLGSGGTYAGNISIATNATLYIQSDANQTLSGVISGDGNLTKSYVGTLTLSGTNTYSGDTIVEAGSLVLAAGGSSRFHPTLNNTSNKITGTGNPGSSFCVAALNALLNSIMFN